jgi:hypothetical protein
MATVVQSDDDIARKAKALYKKVRTFQDYLTLIEKVNYLDQSAYHIEIQY